MILAAGRGERMRPLTDKTPKPLLKINHKPLITYHIERLAAANISDIVINHAWLGEQIVETLGDGKKWGVNIHYSAETDVLETGGGIFKALPLLGDDPFLVVNADVWCDLDYSRIEMDLKYDAHLVLVNNPEHHVTGDFHLEEATHLLSEQGSTKKTYSGIGLYTRRFFDDCKEGRFPLAPLLRQKMQAQKVSGQFYSGLWMDIGTPERLKILQQRMLES